ncbi:transcriptional regulator [Nocardia mangyaensis]|uniref:Transcriptional regulator n=1 Tax=Nocardia mangyaensis TaxID=2213200 RepID=A0A1J0VTN5_9NOCA|nr:helix-turn-helix transcriptional regulator [Nocardia mangyaensis]APE35405.1 transcriptional regulator [Nocardia mangyaensis]
MGGPKPTRVSNRIRDLRTERKLTQAELAATLDVTRQTIIAIEHGRYSPSLEMAFQIAQVLRAPLEEVFTYKADETS